MSIIVFVIERIVLWGKSRWWIAFFSVIHYGGKAVDQRGELLFFYVIYYGEKVVDQRGGLPFLRMDKKSLTKRVDYYFSI
jgi:hypothetical protein